MDGFLLSPQQKRIWQAQQKAAYDGAITGRLLITGPLVVARLQDALNAVYTAHEIARTAFRQPPGMLLPLQFIEEDGAIGWSQRDISALTTDEQVLEIDRLWSGPMVEEGSDGAPAAWQATLVKTGPNAHELFLRLSALTADRYTVSFLAAQLAAAYTGTPLDAEETLQYADYAEWQAELLEDEAAVQAWRERGKQAPLLARLPYGGDDGGRFQPRRLVRTLPVELSHTLRQMAATLDRPLEDLLLTAWAVLLSQLTGQDSFILGVTEAGRTYEELTGAVGPYAKRLPLPLSIDLDAPYAKIVADVCAVLTAGSEAQEYFPDDGPGLPFGFASVTLPPPITAGALTISLSEQRTLIDPVQVALVVQASSDLVRTHLVYDAAHLSASNGERLIAQYHALLSSLTKADAAVPAGSLPYLPADEVAVVAALIGEPISDQGSIFCLHENVAVLGGTDPGRLAAVSATGSLTYGELNRQADRLAAYLVDCGVGPGVNVALFAEPALETVVGLVAVLKAGGAYVPIDPQYPTERIRYVLADSGAQIILTQSALKETVPAAGAQIVLLDGAWPAGSSADGRTPGPDDPAYVIYTSGSTGQPKGVVVSHRNLWHSTMARLDYYGGRVGRYLLLSSFAFDSSVAGIFWTMATGGALLLPAAELARDPAALVDFIDEHKPTHTLTLPSLYQMILDTGHRAQLASLRTVIVAGEACPAALVDGHAQTLPAARLYNEYGPTEGTVWASVFDCRRPFAGPVPIGRPAPGVELQVLNAYQQLTPVGVAGELYIGGPTVTNGYLNRPEQTADRFVTLTIGGVSNRYYRAGDLARWRPDGQLDFLGRADFQVKIRGYRIELGEIEAQLEGSKAVREAVVVAPPAETAAEQRLIAYLTSPASLNVAEIRGFLLDRLPPYMIPDTFVFLDELPRTPNGKVDRDALPDPARTRAQLGSTYVAPRDALEEVLVGIWTDLLAYDEIGIDDNFFTLGGHSILVTQMVGRIRDLLPLGLSLRAVFDKPTVSELADHLRAENGRERADKAAALLQQVLAGP